MRENSLVSIAPPGFGSLSCGWTTRGTFQCPLSRRHAWKTLWHFHLHRRRRDGSDVADRHLAPLPRDEAKIADLAPSGYAKSSRAPRRVESLPSSGPGSLLTSLLSLTSLLLTTLLNLFRFPSHCSRVSNIYSVCISTSSKPRARVCVCVCVCVCVFAEVCFNCFVLRFVMGYVLQFGEIPHEMMMSWCLMSSDVIWHIRDKLWPMPKHGSIKSTYVRCMRV